MWILETEDPSYTVSDGLPFQQAYPVDSPLAVDSCRSLISLVDLKRDPVHIQMQKCVVYHELRDILAYPLVPKLWSKDQGKTGVPMPLFAMRQERRKSHKFWGFLGVFIRFGIAVIAWEGFDYAEHIWISLCDEVFVLFLEVIASWDHKALRD